ncbi:jg14898 [Pararge aegeria aegeria]|uniref:Jg14898 protein n=1 Tax=Pararge aegeria aegeria TaxID=348720 RepID=A0A8S4R4K6_9NEOP|nr:jg14898 [Pararge aegeria aegeria]
MMATGRLLPTYATQILTKATVSAALTSETLLKLNISLDRLPRQSRSLLENVAENQKALHLQTLDPISISLYRSRELSEKLEDEYELLGLRQKNTELQAKIDRNDRFIAKLRNDLESSKRNLSNQNPNPDNIHEFIRQLKQKLTVYEESYGLAKNKYLSLNVPEAILPKSLMSQIASLEALSEEAAALKAQADDVMFMRETKAILTKLRR